jgi:cytochrome P450
VRAYLVNHPNLIESVLVDRQANFVKGRLVRASRYLFGDGLLTSEGAAWQQQRRLVLPAFHRERIAVCGDAMVTYTERMLSTWRVGETRDLFREMQRLTLEIIAKLLFDVDVAERSTEIGDALQVAWTQFAARVRTGLLVPERLPTPGALQLRRAIKRLDRIVYALIEQRRREGRDRGDLLSLLLQARDAEDSPLTDKELHDQVLTLFVAGHETTAVALAWSWYLLAQHPRARDRLDAELEELPERIPSITDLPRLQYTESIVKEALRLYPPVWGISRVAVEAGEIGRYAMPAGTSIAISPWVTHRDPRYYARPDEFNPDRWREDPARPSKFTYFPFGGGPRQCLGQSLAMTEAVLLLATTAQRFRFELVSDSTIVPFPSITLHPGKGVRYLVEAK